MNILEKIVNNKVEEIAVSKRKVPLSKLLDEPLYHIKGYSLIQRLRNGDSVPIIAEFKRKSPSKGWIKENGNPLLVTKGYSTGNAAAISVLTDIDFFGGALDDLLFCSAFAKRFYD
jgi:indole-3-glycerol phosphate synthase